MLLVSEEDVHDGLVNPPPIKMIVNEDGTMIKMATLSDVLQPKYRRCKTCSAKHRCSRVQKKGREFLDVDCVIEKDALDVMMTRLSLDGVTVQDEMLVFPLVRLTFQLIRLYELETVIDLSRVLRDNDAMKFFKDLNTVITKMETQQLKYLKELMATKKEGQKQTVHTVKSGSYDLAKRLSEKKHANEKKQFSETEE